MAWFVSARAARGSIGMCSTGACARERSGWERETVSSIHSDRGWLVVAFRLMVNGRVVQVRLYPGIRDNREGRRSPAIKEIRELIQMRNWVELAKRYPRCKQLQSFRGATPDQTTLREASERFLAYQANVNKPATVEFYRDIFAARIWTSELSAKPLRLIGASDVAALFKQVHESGRQAQAANVRRALKAVFNWAKYERGIDGEYLVSDNPVMRTKRLETERKGDEIQPFSEREVRDILSAAGVGWERRIVAVAFGAGLDPGENFGLRVADLDFSRRQIHVRQRFTRFGQGAVKNIYRRREVEMTDAVYRALKEQVAAIELRSPWLWARNGKPHNPATFSNKIWPTILKRAGVPHRAFYQCRHTFATKLLQEGREWREIAEQMGHSNLKMLMEHYWKWRPGSIKSERESI